MDRARIIAEAAAHISQELGAAAIMVSEILVLRESKLQGFLFIISPCARKA
jgi:hypothetical protein